MNWPITHCPLQIEYYCATKYFDLCFPFDFVSPVSTTGKMFFSLFSSYGTKNWVGNWARKPYKWLVEKLIAFFFFQLLVTRYSCNGYRNGDFVHTKLHFVIEFHSNCPNRRRPFLSFVRSFIHFYENKRIFCFKLFTQLKEKNPPRRPPKLLMLLLMMIKQVLCHTNKFYVIKWNATLHWFTLFNPIYTCVRIQTNENL